MRTRLHSLAAGLLVACGLHLAGASATGQDVPSDDTAALASAQQAFIDLRFGMFIHFNIPTFADADWPDPRLSPRVFDPARLDAAQWAAAAKSANMTHGCLTTKHHSGFCIWKTDTTDYSVAASPFKRDVVGEFADAFRAAGLKVMLYFSILDTHHNIRPNWVEAKHTAFIKAQLTELLTRYGEISAIIIDGWDAPWSRLSYEEVPFEEIYRHIKSLQPECLVLELNAGKYPREALFYTDIKSYEQNAGQKIARDSNVLPSMSCLPLNEHWFWKTDFPDKPVKDPARLVTENIVPLNSAQCNFILNVAPNRDGLLDDNALAALAEIGRRWKHAGPLPALAKTAPPIVTSNLAKFKRADSSWSYDTQISDFANDDNFGSAWVSHPSVRQPWYEIIFDTPTRVNTALFVENDAGRIKQYRIEGFDGKSWQTLAEGGLPDRVQTHRFAPVTVERVRLQIPRCDPAPGLREFCLYNEVR